MAGLSLSYGKRMLRRSLQNNQVTVKQRTPQEEARFWIQCGLDPDGLILKYISDYIGYGVLAGRKFNKGDFLLHYCGTLLRRNEVKDLEQKHARAGEGCCMFYFSFKEKRYCIDATEHNRMGRMVNDATSSKINSKMEVVNLNDIPYLCLFAIREIEEEEEILYDYGEKSMHWRKEVCDQDPQYIELFFGKVIHSETTQAEKNEESLSHSDVDQDPFDLDKDYVPDTSESEPGSDSRISEHIPFFGKLLQRVQPATERKDNSQISSHQQFQHYQSLPKPQERFHPYQQHQGRKNGNTASEQTQGPVGNQIHLGEMDSKQVDKSSQNKVQEDIDGHVQDLDLIISQETVCGEMHFEDLMECQETEENEDFNPGAAETAVELPDQHLSIVIEKAIELPGQHVGFTCDVCCRKFKRKGGHTVHMQTHFKVKDQKYQKPIRKCPFCETVQTQLARHIASRHSYVAEVAEAIKLEKSSHERKNAFDKFRKEGIFKRNKQELSKNNPNIESERKGPKDLVCCSKCKGFYARQFYYRHKDTCLKDGAFSPASIPPHALRSGDQTDKFTTEVLGHFQQDEPGIICITDPTIILIGRRLFQKNLRKVEKAMETRKSVMSDMRLLAKLFISFKENSVGRVSTTYMFDRRNFSVLEKAIEIVTVDDSKLKHGTKNALFYLLKNSGRILMGNAIADAEDEKAEEFEKFIHLLELNQNLIFGDAAYAINQSRQEKLRMPEQQADEKEVQKVREHTLTVIKELTSDFEMIAPKDFVSLRDAVCARLTLFNARRGGEPCRLRLNNVADAVSKRWIDYSHLEQLESFEKDLFKEMLVAYQPGKGNHLVPVLIPTDCIKGLKIPTDPAKRKDIGVLESNVYAFPNTQGSTFHVQGWDAIISMCDGAAVDHPELLTASKQRHRISTLYAAMEVPTHERDFFYKHMGHSKGVIEGVYQYPLPLQEVTKVGKHLLHIDKGGDGEMDECVITAAASRANPASDPVLQPSPDDSSIPLEQTGSDDSSIPLEQTGSSSMTGRKNYRWTVKDSCVIRERFKQWICLPQGNTLPRKKELMTFLAVSNLQCSFLQLRTKIMNEQNREQKLCKKRWEAFEEN